MQNNLPAINPERRPLPKIDDLYQDIELASKFNELNRLLNCSPKPEWIKINPFAQNSKYIPIGIIEYLLTSIFIQWKVEIKEVKLIANSVLVVLRVWAVNPISGEWEWQEGIGAAPLKTAKGAGATDFEKILDSSVQTGAPAAESYAIKDACEKWGKIFGKDLNRKDEHLANYGSLEGKLTPVKPGETPQEIDIPEILVEVIAGADKENLAAIYAANPELHHNPKFMELLTARKAQLFKTKTNGTVGQPA